MQARWNNRQSTTCPSPSAGRFGNEKGKDMGASDIVNRANDVTILKSAYAEEAAEISSNVKYCSGCGSSIDSDTKLCTGCGRQYFRWPKNNRLLVTLLSVLVCKLAFEKGIFLNSYNQESQEVAFRHSWIQVSN